MLAWRDAACLLCSFVELANCCAAWPDACHRCFSLQGTSGPVGLVLRQTSFYAEQGGQVADTGAVDGPSGASFAVEDTQVRFGHSAPVTSREKIEERSSQAPNSDLKPWERHSYALYGLNRASFAVEDTQASVYLQS